MASIWSKTPLSPGNSILDTPPHEAFSPRNFPAYQSILATYGAKADGRLMDDLTLNTSWNSNDIIYYRDGIPAEEIYAPKDTKDTGTQTSVDFCNDKRHLHLEHYYLVPMGSTLPLSPTSDYSSPTSPKTFNFPSTSPLISPFTPTSPLSPTSPTSRKRFDFNLNSFAADFATKTSIADASKKKTHHNTFCGFCYNNARVNGCDVNGPGRWLEHNLRDKDGRVTCPCLRMFQCPICGGSGDEAHTQRHCPKRNQRPL